MPNTVQLNAILKLIDAEVDARVLQKISRATAGLPNALGNAASNAQNATKQIGALGNQVAALTGGLTAGERAGRLLLQRMTQFAILLPTFVTLNRAIQGSIGFLVAFENEINRIISLNPDILAGKFQQISKAAFEVAEATRTSALDAAKGISLFAQAGFDLAKSVELVKVSSLAAKVSTLEVADSQELAIATLKVFGDQIGSLEEAFDKIVAVEDLAAAGAQDIAEAFRTGGNALAFATKSFDDTLALVSALREQTRKSGREVGTFFKTLATRITAAGESQTALKNLGVQVTNLDGTVRPLLDILVDLKGTFDGLTESQQANASKAIAGVRQFESFLAVMNSLDRAVQLADASSRSFGTVQEKNEIIAQSISEQFAELVIQGQKVAKALGDAGISEALVSAIDAGKVFLNVLEETSKLLNKIGASVTPLITLFGGAGLASVLGFGGGARALLGFGKKGEDQGSVSANTEIAKLAQVSSAASTSIGQLVQQAQLEARVNRLAIGLQQDGLGFLKEGSKANRLYTATFQGVINTGKAIQPIFQNTASRVFALTVASTFAAQAINGLSSVFDAIIPGGKLLGEGFRDTASAGLQAGLQFGIISKNAGLLAGSIATTITALQKLKIAFEEEFAAQVDNNNIQKQNKEISSAQTDFAGSLGSILATQIQKQVNGLTSQDIDLTKVLEKSLKESASLQLAFLQTGLQGLQRAFFSKEGIGQIAKLDPAQFIDEDAFKELQNSFDSTGKSSLSLAEQQKLLFRAMGQVDQSFIQVTTSAGEVVDVVGSAIVETFDTLKDLGSLINEGLGLQQLNTSLNDFKLSVKDIPEGIDALKIAAERANDGFISAKEQADKLRQALVQLKGPDLGISPGQAQTLFFDLASLIRKEGANAEKAFADYLANINVEQRDFAKEAFAIEKDIIESETERFKTIQQLNKEIAEQTKKVADDERDTRISAAKALDDFKISLLEFGDITDASAINIDEIAQSFAALDDVQKAQLELGNVSKKTALEIDKVQQEIAGIDEQISKLKQTGLEDAFKEAALQNEKANKQLEIEKLQRQETIDTIKAQIELMEAEKKAAEEARKKEEERLKALRKLEEETNDFKRAIQDAARAFDDFQLDKLAELTETQSDAFAELHDAQVEVLDATKNVEEAYKDFIQAILDVNGAITEAQINSNLLERDIQQLTGGIVSFQDKLFSLDDAFSAALDDANITLEKRIELERQLANETLEFIRQARDEITQAGLGVFGQSSQENQELGQGIAALSFVVEQLGGSFENFLQLGDQELAGVGQELLNLPLSLRQSILDALSALPSTFSIGGFNVDQIKDALGQVGAGVAPEIGLPSLEELTTKEVEQLQILQDLAFKDAQVQFSQVAIAQAQLEKAEEALAIAKIEEVRATEALVEINERTAQEIAVLELANIERQELTERIISANDTVTLRQIEEEARLFAEQNSVFRDIGKEIVQGISTAINARFNQLEAAAAVGSSYGGHIPNFAKGNLSPREAAGLLKAASIEKRHMPAGAGLAVANTSEAIIPMRNKGFIPNYQGGSPIAAGIEAVQGTNQAVVAAIASSISQALQNSEGDEQNITLLSEISEVLVQVRDELSLISESSAVIQTNTAENTSTVSSTPTTQATDININLQTNQNQQIRVTGLDSLVREIETAVKAAAAQQVEEQISPLSVQIRSVIDLLRQRGLLSSLGQAL